MICKLRARLPFNSFKLSLDSLACFLLLLGFGGIPLVLRWSGEGCFSLACVVLSDKLSQECVSRVERERCLPLVEVEEMTHLSALAVVRQPLLLPMVRRGLAARKGEMKYQQVVMETDRKG